MGFAIRFAKGTENVGICLGGGFSKLKTASVFAFTEIGG